MAIEDFDQVTIAPAKLRPFTKFIMSIGELPTSYLDSLSYAEQVTWFCDYLQNNVIPALNNNATALEEVQNLMTELQEYVDNYLTEENLQPMINTKIDDMVEDGTMAQIINQEVLGALNNRVETLENNAYSEIAVVGDSYTASYGSDWAEKLALQLNLTLHKSASGGSGWIRTSIETHFIDLLNAFNTSGNSVYMTATERNKTKYLITYGGINDANDVHNSGETDLISAMDTYISTAKTLFPNAQILIVGPQMMSTESELQKYPECQKAMSKACLKNGVAYADARYWLLDSNYQYTETYRSDYLHPSTLGFNIITSKMLGLINNSIASTNTTIFTFANGITGTVSYRETNELLIMDFKLNGTFAAGGDITIGTFNNSLKDFITSTAYPVFKSSNYDYINGILGGVKVASGNTIYMSNTSGAEYTGRIKFMIILPKVVTKITVS